jgi:hypothetical protein
MGLLQFVMHHYWQGANYHIIKLSHYHISIPGLLLCSFVA